MLALGKLSAGLTHELNQVWTNVIDKAIDSAPDGGILERGKALVRFFLLGRSGPDKHVIDEAIIFGLRCTHPVVAVSICFNFFRFLARVVREDTVQALLHFHDLACLDFDI